jgi:mRNA interferase MazF
MAVIIKQRDIVLVDFSPNIGHEQGGLKPAVIVSADSFHVSGLCFVCLITSKLKNYAGDIIMDPNNTNGLTKKSEILIGQFKTIDQIRVTEKIGTITEKELDRLFIGLDGLLNR